MADVNRLRIVRRLASGEATVAELIAHVGLSQPLVSWHLGRLRAAGVVVTRRQGRETICRLREEAFTEFAAHERAVLGVAGLTTCRSRTNPAAGSRRSSSRSRSGWAARG